MAYEIPGFSFTLTAGEDFRTTKGQFRFVALNATGLAVQANAQTLSIAGVRQNTPDVTEAVTCVSSGIVFVEAGAACPIGKAVTSDATGRAIPGTAANAVGIAMETASAAGILIAVLLSGPQAA